MRVCVRRVVAGLVLGAGVAATVLAAPAPESAAQGPPQPIAFSHKLHAGNYKIDCQYCHADARRSTYAGIPSVKRCMGCHAIAGADKPEVQKVQQFWKEAQPIPWIRLHKVPGYVSFPHKRHVAAGVTCQTCHGPVETMVVLARTAPLTMGWCVDCHTARQGPLDCVSCHH
jgi:hypothetical protein